MSTVFLSDKAVAEVSNLTTDIKFSRVSTCNRDLWCYALSASPASQRLDMIYLVLGGQKSACITVTVSLRINACRWTKVLWQPMDSSDWVHQSPSQPEKPRASPLQLLVLTKWRMTRRGKDTDQMLQAQVHAPSRVEKGGKISLTLMDCLFTRS